jgi:BlaI family transcriptional regulator, penicillinase repressor
MGNKPTEAELAVLKVLWERGEATVRDIYESLYRDANGYTAALKLLQVMHAKGLVARDDSQRAHVYRACVSRDQATRSLLDDLLERFFDGSSSELVLSALGSGPRPSRDELLQIRALLDRIEAERGSGRTAQEE